MKIEILHDKEHLCEAFGMSHKLFDALVDSMHEFFHNEKNYGTELPIAEVSFSDLFEKYLQSDQFKKCVWEPKTPNDYFMLGYSFALIHMHIKSHVADAISRLMTGIKPAVNDDDVLKKKRKKVD